MKVLVNWTSMFEVTDALQSASEPTPMPQNGNTSAGHVSEIPDPLLKVTNFEEARRIHAEAEAKNIELAEEQTRREAELDKQIADLDAQIRELYDQWGQSGKKLLEFGNEQ